MALINKISFLTSTQRITGRFLNALQNSTRFDGVSRTDTLSVPSIYDESRWAVNQRDGLLDWEVNPNSVMGNKTWGGRIISSNGEDYAPAQTVFTNNQYSIYVYGGRALGVNKQVIEWDTQLVVVQLGNVQNIYVDVNTSMVVASTSAIPQNQIPLAQITVDGVGIITEYIDLRPSSFIVDFSDRNRALEWKTGEITTDYVLEAWERLLVNTQNGSLYVDLPLNPANNTEVSIVDSEGYFHLYPVFLRPAPDGDNTGGTTINGIDNDVFALTQRYSVTTLVYSSEKNAWYFTTTAGNSSNNFKKGTFLSCGGRQAQPESLSCVAGEVPVEYANEDQPPVYEIIDGRCWLAFQDNTALYSNPELLDNFGVKANFNDSRCINQNNAIITAGNFGFDSEEFSIRSTTSQTLIIELDVSILPSLGLISNAEEDLLRDLTNRLSYAIIAGLYNQVSQLEEILIANVDTVVLQGWYTAVLSLLPPLLVQEFEDALDWIITL